MARPGTVRAPVAKTDADVALRLAYDVRLGERKQIALETYVIRDCDQEKLDEVIDRMVSVGTKLELRFKLEELEQREKVLADELANLMESYTNKNDEFQQAFASRGKKGDFKADGNQEKYLRDNQGMQDRHRLEIRHLRSEMDYIRKRLEKA